MIDEERKRHGYLGATSGHGPRPDAFHYTASKAAIIHLSRTWLSPVPKTAVPEDVVKKYEMTP